MFRMRGLLILIGTLVLIACSASGPGEPAGTSGYQEVPYTPLVLEEADSAAFAGPGIPGCALEDLRPFNWKTVASGLVDIRSAEEHAVQTASLYQEGYLDYQQAQVESSERYGSVPQMRYEEFFATCNVFPAVDFTRYSLLGKDETGTGCTVSFERRVFRDDEKKRVVFQLTVVEGGACEKSVRDRNLILVPRIPPDYGVTFEYGPTILLPGGVSSETDPRVTPETLRALVEGNNGFAFDLFKAVAQEEGNLFFSPHSISTALAMAYAGGRGATSVQMADVLHYTVPQSQLHPALNTLNRQLTAGDDEGFALLIANALWRQERYATITPYASGEGWQAASVAYQGGRAHMLILLPAEGHFETFAGEVDAARLAEIEAALAPTDLLLYLPRFEYAAELISHPRRRARHGSLYGTRGESGRVLEEITVIEHGGRRSARRSSFPA